MSLVCNAGSALFPEELRIQVERNVVRGSSEFLNAWSQAATVWRFTELAEEEGDRLDNAMQANEQAIAALKSARERYIEILDLLEEHGPSEEALDALENFDYDQLAKRSGFQGDQWNRLINEAQSGNVYGLLADFVEGVGRLIDLHENLQPFFESGRMPPMTSFGDLTNEYQLLVMHGHQSAQIFRNLGVPAGNLAAGS